ncbi:hypothetical protein [Sphingosinithalassobacter portus]|uniref:hypothetical protein n=1 Tax=Stakelama portus TaxID=2676234 RepID=UPI000D6DED06|nr:hypothetical protein [Sphingosinithalassobacter portus]
MQKSVFLTFVAITASMATAQSANAQSRPVYDREIPSRGAYEVDAAGNRLARSSGAFHKADGEQNRDFELARAFASCAVGMGEARTRLLLDQEVPAKHASRQAEDSYFSRLRNCATQDNVQIDRVFLRGALSEALILDSVPAESLKAAASGDEVIAFVRGVSVADSSMENPLTLLQLSYECRVAAEPVRARTVLEKTPGSGEEAAALTALKIATPSCDSIEEPEGTTNFFRRSFVARALYHWSSFESWGR